jgi:hypothetical protein
LSVVKKKGGRKMTTNTCAKCGFYSENRSARRWKAIAFAGGLVLGLYSGPFHAAPTSDGKAELLAMTAARTFWKLPFEFPAAIRSCGHSHRRISSTPKPTRSGEIG